MNQAQEFICNLFKKHDVVLLGEEHRIQENLLFVQSLIPKLYKIGVFNIGMEFGSYEVQDELDDLVNGKIYDEQKARDIMFHYNVAWPMKEYMDIYRKAFEFNRKLCKFDKKMRVLNLSYQYNWKEFKGIRYPEDSMKIFKKGSIEKFRTSIVEKEIISKDEKILILTGTIHAFTKYKYPVYDSLEDNFYRYIDKDFGHLLYRYWESRVTTVLLHQKFPKRLLESEESPCCGVLEKWFVNQDNGPMAVDLRESPVGQFQDYSDYSIGHDNFTLSDLADGYIFLKPFKQLNGTCIDRAFLKGKEFDYVQENFPDPDWHKIPNTEEEYWNYIEDFVKLKKYRE